MLVLLWTGCAVIPSTFRYELLPSAAPEGSAERLVLHRSVPPPRLLQALLNISQHIDKAIDHCYPLDYDGSTHEVLTQRWAAYTGGRPIFINRKCFPTQSFGNYLGYYLNDLACSDISGMHFLSVHADITFQYHQSSLDLAAKLSSPEHTARPSNSLLFFQHLPDVIPHPHPLSDSLQLVARHCQCEKYCWEDPKAPWLQRIELIAQVIRHAIDGYAEHTHAMEMGTLLNTYDIKPAANVSTTKRTSNRKRRKGWKYDYGWLPLVPNVTIQYRCGDNLNLGKGYGLLPFSTYTKESILKKGELQEADVEYIYVLTEEPARSRIYTPCKACCTTILHKLFHFLSNQFPSAYVVIKRGGDMFLDYARISRSNVVFCSASTFCLWPALTNAHGIIHMPYTSLLAGASNASVAPKLTKNIFWMDAPLVQFYNGSIPALLEQLGA